MCARFEGDNRYLLNTWSAEWESGFKVKVNSSTVGGLCCTPKLRSYDSVHSARGMVPEVVTGLPSLV